MTVTQAVLSVIISVAVGEGLKLGRQLLQREKLKAFPLGGFVSVHSAVVSSLFLAVYFETGMSLLLLACGVFAGIVLRDAFGVRWEVSKHSEALNKLTKSEQFSKTGHQKQEVVLGIVLGLAVTGLVYLLL